MDEQLELTTVNNSLAKFVTSGVLDKRILELLVRSDGFLPVEYELLDYKREAHDNAAALAKSIVQIASFHNTYGGYLIYGVEEVKRENRFQLASVSWKAPDVRQLMDQFGEYTGHNIQLVMKRFPVPDTNAEVAVLYVPKRTDAPPIAMEVRGPETKAGSGKFVFGQGDVFFRRRESCLLATEPKHWMFLAKEREPPLRLIDLSEASAQESLSPLENNLPDRALVCPFFVGREESIATFWRWLGDEFSFSRLIAGEGGLGKTSIAYEFAEQVCKTRPSGFGRVLWLSAKQKQFRAMDDKYQDLNDPSFSTYEELLTALCLQFGYNEEETAGRSEKFLKALLKAAFKLFPSLVVLDDLDSLIEDDQRKALELVAQISDGNVRFLATTRSNFSFSTASSIRLQGLDLGEVRKFVDRWSTHLKLPLLSDTEVAGLHTVSCGSPLFIESLIRLLKNGMEFHKALNQWKGSLGELVRQAALREEVESLKPTASKALLATAILGNCSYSELKAATQYTDMVLNNAVEELNALFLLSAPRVTREPRFEVNDNVRRLVVELEKSLVADPKKLREHIYALQKQQRQLGGLSSSGQSRPVGIAIRQALSQLQQGSPEEAVKTAVAARVGEYENNPDLLALHARCLLRLNNRTSEARTLLKRATDLPTCKPLALEIWYDLEEESAHSRVEVCSRALDRQDVNKDFWLERRIRQGILCAGEGQRSGNLDSALSSLQQCAEDCRRLLKRGKFDGIQTTKEQTINLLSDINDFRTTLAFAQANKGDSWAIAFETCEAVVNEGDDRVNKFETIIEALSKAVDVGTKKDRREKSKGLLRLLASRASKLLTNAKLNVDIKSELEAKLRNVADKI